MVHSMPKPNSSCLSMFKLQSLGLDSTMVFDLHFSQDKFLKKIEVIILVRYLMVGIYVMLWNSQTYIYRESSMPQVLVFEFCLA
jgi:hypothetical protein